tara:strand:- start:1312 stop:1725 length:414 start_codon:yes stop_codon:yes gene_type:complete
MNPSNSQILKTFLKQFNEFLEDILRIFPDDQDLITAKVYFDGIRKINPKLIINYWKYLIAYKYDDEVENENIDFFIEKDYVNDIEDIATKRSWEGDYSYINDKITVIRDSVRKQDDNNKKITMKYIINLTRLSKLYN